MNANSLYTEMQKYCNQTLQINNKNIKDIFIDID